MECFGERGVGWLAEEEMDVLGHDDVAEDFEAVTAAGKFERIEEGVS